MPARLVELAAVAYGLAILALTTGPQPPGRFDLVGNIILFVPVGALITLRWPRLHPLTVVVIGFGVSCAIEAAQLVVLLHRDPSLNDLALNTAGTALGYVAGRTVMDVLGWLGRRWRTRR